MGAGERSSVNSFANRAVILLQVKTINVISFWRVLNERCCYFKWILIWHWETGKDRRGGKWRSWKTRFKTTTKRERKKICIKLQTANLPVGWELTLAGDSLAVDDATICVWLDATVLDWDCDNEELFAVWWGGVDCCCWDCVCNCDCVSGNCCCCETSWLICWWWCNKGGLCDRSGVPDPVWISSYTRIKSQFSTMSATHTKNMSLFPNWCNNVIKLYEMT